MAIVYNLFLYTGILGTTLSPEFQLAMNIIYTLLSMCALIIPFCFSKFYFTDNRYILCSYIITVYCVYISCVNYFRKKMDKLLFSNFEQECTNIHLFQLKTTICMFFTIGVYCFIGIPVSLYFTEEITTLQLCLACVVGCFWFLFYIICCAFYTYILLFCLGQSTVYHY